MNYAPFLHLISFLFLFFVELNAPFTCLHVLWKKMESTSLGMYKTFLNPKLQQVLHNSPMTCMFC